jgi:oxygen-dependent protoporphyrinogen oxidase
VAGKSQEFGYDGVVLACPAYRAAELLENLDPELVSGLEQVPYSSTATVHLTYEESRIGEKLRGSGFVVPHTEKLDITACTYSHLKYPGRAARGKALLRVHLGGQLNPNTLREDDEALTRRAIETLGSLLKIDGQPLSSRIVRHSKVVPQYAVGHLKLREKLDQLVAHHSGLALGGNGIHGVGLADCVKQASVCAQQIHGQVL